MNIISHLGIPNVDGRNRPDAHRGSLGCDYNNNVSAMKQPNSVHTSSSKKKKRGRPAKDLAHIQRSIQLGSPEELAKKILSTPPGKIKLQRMS